MILKKKEIHRNVTMKKIMKIRTHKMSFELKLNTIEIMNKQKFNDIVFENTNEID